MISLFKKSIILKNFNILINSLPKYSFQGQNRTSSNPQNQNDSNEYQNTTSTHTYRQNQKRDFHHNKKLFRPFQAQFKKPFQKRRIDQQQTNVQEYVKTINEINQDFLGIKQNTNYFKIYTQKKFQDIVKAQGSNNYKINDLPFNVRSKQQQEKKQNQNLTKSQLTNNLATKMFKKMINQQKIIKDLEKLVKSYFKDLVTRQRKCNMQPNFEMYSRKVVETLKANKTSIKLVNEQSNLKINLKNVSLFKGVKVNRNDNYSIDSYEINYKEEKQNIITYTLWKKQRQSYPEDQWFAQKFIMARIQADVSDVPVIQVIEQNQTKSSNKGLTHSFVFQVDLIVPPSLSVLSLSPQQFLNSYRLKPSNIQITNVDNKNIYFNLAFKQEDKKKKLINKII